MMALHEWLWAEQTASLPGWAAWRQNNQKSIPRTDRYGRQYGWIDEGKSFWHGTALLDLAPADVYQQKPPGYDRGEVPTHPIWKQNRYLFPRAVLPVLIQSAWYYFFPTIRWHWSFAALFYFVSYGLFAFAVLRYLHYWMGVYGCLDEEHRPRQLAPDDGAVRVGFGLWLYAFGRAAMFVWLAWDSKAAPTFDLWSYPKVCAFLIALDYYFYAAHRSYHQVDSLWRIHSLHHSVRHPTPGLAILSDDIQEIGEIWVLPLLAYLTVPLNFHELYVASAYLLFVEAAGHAGIRAHWGHPVLQHILRPFDMDLEIEDHDLHHRHGRGGKNYGKQTRIFDRLFNTVDERVEGKRVPVEKLVDIAEETKAHENGLAPSSTQLDPL